MSAIEHEIRRYFCAHDGEWVMPKEQMELGRMLKQAVDRIDDLQHRLDEAEAMADDWENSFDMELAEEKNRYTEMFDELIKASTQARKGASSFITLIDKAIKAGVKDGD